MNANKSCLSLKSRTRGRIFKLLNDIYINELFNIFFRNIPFKLKHEQQYSNNQNKKLNLLKTGQVLGETGLI